MTAPVVTYTFDPIGFVENPKAQTNFDDLLKYLRDLNAGTTVWDELRTYILDILENTPSQITAAQNDYAIGNYTVLRLSTDASRTITGFSGSTQGRVLWIYNIGSFNIVIADQSLSSSATNRIITGIGANVTLLPNEAMMLWYDNTTQRWRVGNTNTAKWG